MKIGIYQNLEHDASSIVESINKNISSYNFERDDNNPDILFFVGGDGTFLKAIQKYLDKLDSIKFIGINNGRLGFFYDFCEEDIDFIFTQINEDKLVYQTHRLLEADVSYKETVCTLYAMNEIRIENPFRTLTSDVYIDEQYLETFRGNGLVVASSLGSSAYNRSLGGAIINPNIELLELTEIASLQNNAFRSLGSSFILSGEDTVTLKGNFEHVVIGYDNSIKEGQVPLQLKIKLPKKKVTVCVAKDYSYIRKINESFVR